MRISGVGRPASGLASFLRALFCVLLAATSHPTLTSQSASPDSLKISTMADAARAPARFSDPSGVAVDGTDNVYVADTLNDTIRRITPGGVDTTLAGLAGSPGSVDGTGADA